MAVSFTPADESGKPKKRKGWLASTFAFAASAAAGVSISMATKTCATALLCSAGAPATVTAITAMACAGLMVGTFRAYMGYRKDKKADANAKFWSGKTVRTIGLNGLISVAAGSLFLHYGDQITETAGKIFDRVVNVFDGHLDAQIASEVAARHAAEGALGTAHEQVTTLTDQVTTLQNNVAAEHAAKIAADNVAQKATDQAAALAEQLAKEKAAHAAAEELAKKAHDEAAALATQLAHEEAARKAAEETAKAAVPKVPAIVVPPVEHTVPAVPSVPVEPAAQTYSVHNGDNLWKIIKTHYDLASNADVQLYTDAVAEANHMTAGTMANHLHIGDQITLPAKETLAAHKSLVLDWKALDAETAARKAAHLMAPAP